jgi:hypothetical protein
VTVLARCCSAWLLPARSWRREARAVLSLHRRGDAIAAARGFAATVVETLATTDAVSLP